MPPTPEALVEDYLTRMAEIRGTGGAKHRELLEEIRRPNGLVCPHSRRTEGRWLLYKEPVTTGTAT